MLSFGRQIYWLYKNNKYSLKKLFYIKLNVKYSTYIIKILLLKLYLKKAYIIL